MKVYLPRVGKPGIIISMNQELVDVIKTKILPVVIIVAVVVFFFVMVSDANKPETPATPATPAAPTSAQGAPTDPMKERGQQMAQMKEIIKKSDGDWNHLSAADQQVMNGATGGHGPEALRAMSTRVKKMPEKSPGVPKS